VAVGASQCLVADRHRSGRDADNNPAATPSARVLDAMASDYENSYVRFVLAQSAAHRETVLALPFAADLAAHFAQLADESLAEQRAIEVADTLPFDTFLERYLSPASLNV
jgi:glutamate--cysteine ligase